MAAADPPIFLPEFRHSQYRNPETRQATPGPSAEVSQCHLLPVVCAGEPMAVARLRHVRVKLLLGGQTPALSEWEIR